MAFTALFSSCSRLLKLSRHLHSTLPAAVSSSTWSERELSNLQDALKKHRSIVQLYQPTTPPKTRSMVLLVGWTASTLKVLSKYASIYTENFSIPCLAVAPPAHIIWFTKQGYSFTDRILNTFEQSLDNDRCVSLILHMCSSGGQAVLPRLVRETSNTHSLFATKLHQSCVIFDSGPCEISFRSGVAASKQQYHQGGSNLLTYSLYTTLGVTVNAIIAKRKRQELKDALESKVLDVPQLYLYSLSDSVAPHQWVEEVMEGQKERGRDVSYHCWEDSEHVQHFRQHTQEYIKQITKFLNEYKITS